MASAYGQFAYGTDVYAGAAAPPPPPVPIPPPLPSAAQLIVTDLTSFRSHLFKSTLYAQWKKSNPKEDAAITGYWDGKNARPTGIRTEFGLAYLSTADAYREATLLTMPQPLAPIE